MSYTGNFAPAAQASPRHFVVVLTGILCSGKSTLHAALAASYTAAGFNVIGVPEAATDIIMKLGGSVPADYDSVALQHAIMEAGVHSEKTALRLADLSGQPTLILYDSGTASGAAYVTEEQLGAVLSKQRTSMVALRKRYHLAVNLGGLATLDKARHEFGPECSNPARMHDADAALALAPRLLDAYGPLGDRHVHVLATDVFADKLAAVRAAIDARLPPEMAAAAAQRRAARPAAAATAAVPPRAHDARGGALDAAVQEALAAARA
eukprot:SAG11_NODE_3108_length_2682_cov_70.794038_3_plen_266_part_00